MKFFNPKLKDITCFKFGEKCHTSKYCGVSKKLQERELEEDILQKISTHLIKTSDSKAWSKDSSDEQNTQIDELATTSSSSDSDKSKHINMLTKKIASHPCQCSTY